MTVSSDDGSAELAEGLAALKADIATFGPAEQAVCLTLFRMTLVANEQTDAWAAECQQICTELMTALQGPTSGLRAAVVEVLRGSHKRLDERLAAAEANRS